ncbi:MAG: hypothetical protein LBQ00_05920 [Syntrophobacterales bacterium]|nr:hypothetical protein [Syntrophobacterales bacterium]
MKGKRALSVVVAMGFVLLLSLACYAAYHHMGENDSKKFISAYKCRKGTKLDSCTLCHSGGSYEDSRGNTIILGSCQWCHYSYGYDESGDIKKTLNSYGVDYLNYGRSAKALKAIAKLDSDGDGFTNYDELKARSYPGDATDYPTKVYAPSVTYTRAQLEAMPQHKQFMLMNTSKSGDFYAEYSGVTVEKLLADARISDAATNIKVISPDGFSQYHSLEPDPNWYHVNGTYPEATYHHTKEADVKLNQEYGWCDYSAISCIGRQDGDPIVVSDGLRLLLAIKRDGAYLSRGVLTRDNKLDGEGPFRVVPPQIMEGPPDQSSTASNYYQALSIWPYNASWDHNAGSATRSATIIKVEPLPPGTTDINIYEMGWPYVDMSQIVVYGNIIRAVSINGDAGCTTDRRVSLTVNPPSIPETMIISNSKNRASGKKLPYADSAQWRLSSGKGVKQIYTWFKTGTSLQGPFTSSIYYTTVCPSMP